MKIIFLLINLFLFSLSVYAQNNWQISLSAGGISPRFLIQKPYGHQFEGSLYYTFTESQLGISTGLHRWEVTFGPGGNKFRTIPVLFGGKLLLPQRNYAYYFSGELGFHIIEREYTTETYEIATERVSKFAYRVGGGGIINITEYADIDISIRYNTVAYSFLTNYVTEEYNPWLPYYSFLIGININF
jgi:hypothetical protein